jgi:hypothetical protein
MRKLMLLCAWLCAMAFVVTAGPAQATNLFSHLSNTGSDGNTCETPATACLTLAHALTQTENYGEVDCANSGAYGPSFFSHANVTQSVTIDCAGSVGQAFGGITVSGAGIVVRLRNLSINGEGHGEWHRRREHGGALCRELRHH